MCKNGYVNYSDWSCQILSNSCKMLQTLNSYSLQMGVEGAQHLAGLNPKVCWINAIKSILLHRLCDSSSQHRGGASSKSYSFTGSQCHSNHDGGPGQIWMSGIMTTWVSNIVTWHTGSQALKFGLATPPS